MNPSRSQNRFRLLERFCLLLVLIIACRLIQVQVFKHVYYRNIANRQWEKKISMPAPRGDIFDRHGKPLAISSIHYKVTSSPKVFNEEYKEKAVSDSLKIKLSTILGLSRREINRALDKRSGFSILHEGISLKIDELEALMDISAIYPEKISRRIYPLELVGAPLVGFINAEGKGVSGVEAGLQEELAGMPGEAMYQRDFNGRLQIAARKSVLVEPVRGMDIFLTIDEKVQAITDAELLAGAMAAEAATGSVVVFDPFTGDILALASFPAPKSRSIYKPDEWILLPVQGCYEPGSTMKALSSIALLEHGQVTEESQVDAEDGVAVIDGFTIRDDRPHYGFHTLREAFRVSSNICFAKFSKELSDEKLFATYMDLGFGNRFGLSLPGERTGVLHKSGEWSRRSRLTMVFGQEISATPLQMTVAYGALANEGILMKPRILRATGNKLTGELTLEKQIQLRTACEPATASLLREFMEDVVVSGTGTTAAVPGIRVGGKTGTAQKFENGKLKVGKYMASFIGLAPLDNPRLVIGVFLDEPRLGMHHGGQSAAPIFSRIVEKLAITTPYLRNTEEVVVKMPEGKDGVIVPMLLEMSAKRADSLALRKGLKVTYRGQGRRVVAQEPSPGAMMAPDRMLVLILGDPEIRAGAPPDLMGMSLRAARRLALERGYRIIPRGQGVVVWQGAPDPEEDMAISVQLKQPGERGGR
ncbi:MAG: hypothetical protein GY835_20835 [bacterium]|nr:hypothetical protein [bacterium]